MTTGAERKAGEAFWRANDGRLRELVARGLSMMAASRELGVSRNSVAGRAYKLGLRWGGLPAPEPAPRGYEPFPGHGRCLYPHGAARDADFHFCGAPADGSYCEKHRALCYQPGTSQLRGIGRLPR